jgi:hypothetical protein
MEGSDLDGSIVNLVDFNKKFQFLYPVVHLDFPCVFLSDIAPILGELAFGLSSVGFVQLFCSSDLVLLVFLMRSYLLAKASVSCGAVFC